MKRKPQRELDEIIDDIIAGSPIKDIWHSVTPGGGKSTAPVIAGKLITAGLADRIGCFCPRSALQEQGARAFVDPFFRDMFNHSRTIRTSTNDNNPSRNTDGFITTYQALGVDTRQTVLQDVQKHRYIIIPDEIHHVEQGGVWHDALRPIMAAAAFTIPMTGTIRRGDDNQIAFLDYVRKNRRWEPDFSKKETALITYSRADALREKAIIPLKFFTLDGHASWQTAKVHKRKVKSIAKTSGRDIAPAIYTALNTGFALDLLDKTLKHWNRYRNARPNSQLLVVCADKDGADRAAMHLSMRGIQTRIATSHDDANAKKNIAAFKAGKIKTLVTIAMAYEGLDVPAITHIACLTNIRSIPWIEQMVARAVRVDKLAGAYHTQCAYVFAPDDPMFNKIIEQIMLEQAPFARHGAREVVLFEEFEEEEEGEGAAFAQVTPLGSGVIGEKESFAGHELPMELPDPTPDEIEKQLRKDIKEHIGSYSYWNRHKPGKLNGEIMARFGVKRADMTIEQLERVWAFIQKRWPKDYRRGTGKRCSNKCIEGRLF